MSTDAVNTAEHVGSVYVQHSKGKDMMTISFEYVANGKSKSFNLYRKADEPLSSSFERLKLNLSKFSKPKKLKKEVATEGDAADALELDLYLDDKKVEPRNFKNVDAWVGGAVLRLNGQSYLVKRNEPQVTIMRLPSIIMKGFLTLPSLDVFNCCLTDCRFDWYRQLSLQERANLQSINQPHEIVFDQQSYWLHLSTGLTYSPTSEDVAHHLKVVCHPSDGLKIGPKYTCLSGRPVELGPPVCPFEKRHSFTSKPLSAGGRIRVLTYNILADLYADSDYSRNVLFAHCPAHALEMDYRRQLILKEIHGYNADIICLQEVDKKEFAKTFAPYFKLVSHHTGIYDTKGGQVAEGVATFFRDDTFELLDSHKTILSRLIDPAYEGEVSDRLDEAITLKEANHDTNAVSKPESTDHPILKDINSKDAKDVLARMQDIRLGIQANGHLQKRFMGRHTVLQTSLLRSKDSMKHFVIVANTHLYYAPDADHVRLLQGSVCVIYLEFLKEYYQKLIKAKTNVEDPVISIIFCGDMNSSPDCGLFKLLHEGKVDETLPDWSSNENEAVTGLSVETELRFISAYKDLPYTNYTPGFHGCLDYIYYEKAYFECDSTVPLPEHDDVTATGGIPSDVFPSDHLALIAELSLKSC